MSDMCVVPGLVPLGGATPQALGRFANYLSEYLKSGQPIPRSPFVEWVTTRITGDDKLDSIIMLTGPRGSGKSYSALYLAERLSQRVSEIKGGVASDYFDPTVNCLALEDSQRVIELLNGVRKHNIVIVDDASVAASNRSWNSKENKNLNALITTCRTARCCLIFTIPQKGMLDNQLRNFVDATAVIFHPFHKDGFNVVKIYRDSIGMFGKQYSARISVEGKKIDFWVMLKPSDETTRLYDIQREASAQRLNARILSTGDYRIKSSKMKQEKPDKDNVYLKKFGHELSEFLKKNPTASTNAVAAEFGVHYTVAGRLMKKVKTPGWMPE